MKKGLFIKVLLLIISGVVIVYFLPRADISGHNAEEAKRLQDSILKSFLPYYNPIDSISKQKVQRFESDFNNMYITTTHSIYYQYITNQLEKIYASGIIASDKYDELQLSGTQAIIVAKDTAEAKYFVSQLFTTGRAYKKIAEEMPAGLDRNTLKNLNISDYLFENLQYNEKKSEEVKAQLLQKAEPEKQLSSKAKTLLILLGQIVMVACLLFILPVYLRLFRPEIYAKKSGFIFLWIMITGFSLLAAGCARLNVNIYVIPFAILPIIVRNFFDSRTALTSHVITVFIASHVAPIPAEFIILQFGAGITAIYSLKELTQRSQIFTTALLIFIVYSILYLFYTPAMKGTWENMDWIAFIWFPVNALLVLFAYPLIYLFEKIFGFMSSVTLVELSNINQPILRKLSETAPGTFNHSLQVSNLAAEAASKVGANIQLVRTGALYHDIGKTENPIYFTENQVQGINPHSELPYEESVEIILKHVSDGIHIAEKNGLPKQVIDFIATHHGRGVTKYFYNLFRNEHPNEPVDEEKFMYPGPNPFSKETAILMMADSVEAASRSLSEYTEASISLLVNRIIDDMMNAGLLKNAPLTFKDIETVKLLFIEKLKTIYHTRISYPELNKEADS